jgi:hypothetical protein
MGSNPLYSDLLMPLFPCHKSSYWGCRWLGALPFFSVVVPSQRGLWSTSRSWGEVEWWPGDSCLGLASLLWYGKGGWGAGMVLAALGWLVWHLLPWSVFAGVVWRGTQGWEGLAWRQLPWAGWGRWPGVGCLGLAYKMPQIAGKCWKLLLIFGQYCNLWLE